MTWSDKAISEGVRVWVEADPSMTNEYVIARILDAAAAENDRLAAAYAAEYAIVDRIWKQLGSPSYEELNGRTIYDLIDELKALRSTEHTS